MNLTINPLERIIGGYQLAGRQEHLHRVAMLAAFAEGVLAQLSRWS